MLREYCTQFAGTATIVVVANGCTDATGDVVRALAQQYPHLCLIEIPARIGKGGAVRVGLSGGSEAIAGFVDADGSTSAAEFARLYETFRQSDCDALIGSRWLAGARVEPRQPMSRRLASRTFNAIVRMLFGLGLSDTQCGAKLFRRAAINEVLRVLEVADFAFDIEILWRLKRGGYRILEEPTVWADRLAGTKIRLVRSSLGMLRSVLRLRLKETMLWRLPFLDRFGRFDVIPVKLRPRVLLLGVALADAVTQPELGAFIAYLRERGIDVVDPLAEGGRRHGQSVAQRASQFVWYAFKSPRDYDAILEYAGAVPSWIPAFSSKPAFLLACPGSLQAGVRGRRRGNATCMVLQLDAQLVVPAAETVVSKTLGAGLYCAAFVGEPERLAFRYVNASSGLLEHRLLQ